MKGREQHEEQPVNGANRTLHAPEWTNQPDLRMLRKYTNDKLALAGYLHTIREGFTVLGRQQAENAFNELLIKLAEDRFTLAVLGQFKRGKSSMMNAITGREILPTGVLPLTSVITILKYGPAERLIVYHKDVPFPEEMPVPALASLVTEKENPGNYKKVEKVYLELPLPFLRYGIEFVDTPGVGSSIAANTQTTYRFLPECDAVLFVSAVDTPTTAAELEFLRSIREYVSRIFFVINKTDLVTDDELKEVLAFTRNTIAKSTGIDTERLFAVSSRLAIESIGTGNALAYEKSGFRDLEDALSSFLTREKSALFLDMVAAKAIRFIDEEIAQDIFSEAQLLERLEEIKKDSTRMHHDPFAIAAGMQAAKSNIEAFLQNNLKQGTVPEQNSRTIADDKPVPAQITGEERSITHKEETINLTSDLKKGNCPVCQHIAHTASDFFAHWQYQLVAEEKSRTAFAGELGFCPLHSWQLLAVSSPYGASVGYAPLADELSRRLKTDQPLHTYGAWLKGLVHHSRNCRVCLLLREAEKKYLSLLIEMLETPEGKLLYRKSQGVCIYHLGMITGSAPEETGKLLIAGTAERFSHDAEDMRSFALKQDALRRHLQNQNEKDAYRRMLIRWVGDRRVCMPWAEDGEV